MPSLLKMFALFSMLLLAACGPNTQAPTSATAIVGTKAIIKAHRDEMIAEVTDVTGKLVTTAFTNWDGQTLYTRTDYRGLFPISGTEMGGSQWEVEFDESQLESLFPLQVGKEVAFKGQLNFIDEGRAVDMWAQLEVIAEKTLSLPDGKRKVVVVEFTHEYKFGNTSKLRTEIIYFDPGYSMVLKKVRRESGAQSFWRVIKVERPGNVGTTPTTRQRRSGTVMI